MKSRIKFLAFVSVVTLLLSGISMTPFSKVSAENSVSAYDASFYIPVDIDQSGFIIDWDPNTHAAYPERKVLYRLAAPAPESPAYFALKDIDFGSVPLKDIIIQQAAQAPGANIGEDYPQMLEIRLDGVDGTLIGTFIGKNNGDGLNWADIKASMNDTKVTGIHDVYFVAVSEGYVGNFKSVRFVQSVVHPAYDAPAYIPVDISRSGFTVDWDPTTHDVYPDRKILYKLEGPAPAEPSYFALENVDFGNVPLGQIIIQQASMAGGANVGEYYPQMLEIRLDSPDGALIGTFTGKNTGGGYVWEDIPAVLNDTLVTGLHDVYFIAVSEGYVGNFKSVRFVEAVNNRSAYGAPFYMPVNIVRSGFTVDWDVTDHEAHPDRKVLYSVYPQPGQPAYFAFEDIDFGNVPLGSVVIHQATKTDLFPGVQESGYYPEMLEIRLDSPDGTLIGVFSGKNTGDWHNWTPVKAILNDEEVTGRHDVYFVAANNTFAGNFKAVEFFSEDDTTETRMDKIQISIDSTFDGHNTIVNRPTTNGSAAYNYSVHMIQLDDGTYETYIGGRWASSRGDGDHILKYSSTSGAPGSWQQVGNGPAFWQGVEEGKPNQWFSCNVMEPEVMKAHDGKWIMYTQVEIAPGTPIDDGRGSVSASRWADRIMLLTSDDGVRWTRKEDRGVITNITMDGRDVAIDTCFHHQEVIYVPWDTANPYWMYVFIDAPGTAMHYRIRSDRYDTYDFTKREPVYNMYNLGNQIGYLKDGLDGDPLFVRINFKNLSGRDVPNMQFSDDGLHWSEMNWPLAGSSNNLNNKNCYFLGFTTKNGTGEIPYNAATGQWDILYGATTCTTPVAPEIFTSLIGGGRASIQINENPVATQ